MLSTILTARLNKFLSRYIHADQTAFMKNLQLQDNIRSLSNIIWFTPERKLPVLLYFIDAEMAFDRVEWAFLKEF